MSQLRTFSFGGGVQSTAALVLAVQGKIDYQTFIFANVGNDSEYPATLAYIAEHSRPYAERHGIEFVEVQRVKRTGEVETIYGRMTRPDSRSLCIPVRMNGNGAPGNRSCTGDFKIKVIAKWQKQHGATTDAQAVTGLGISLDEFQRMRSDSGIAWQVLDYPLIDLRLSRTDCVRIIQEAGLPVPPKSSCWFCPFHRLEVWQRMKDNEPELFDKAVALERMLNDRAVMIGNDPVWLTRRLIPLDQAISGNQSEMTFDDNCESGYCHT